MNDSSSQSISDVLLYGLGLRSKKGKDSSSKGHIAWKQVNGAVIGAVTTEMVAFLLLSTPFRL